jgi:hypothetical protein
MTKEFVATTPIFDIANIGDIVKLVKAKGRTPIYLRVVAKNMRNDWEVPRYEYRYELIEGTFKEVTSGNFREIRLATTSELVILKLKGKI